jgi:neutral ceramidase
MTRIDCLDSTGQFKPIGAFSSFSVHPNAVPYALCSNDLYNGEIFAYMEREVEWAIRERYRPQGEAVHAAVNGTPADNSSDYQPGKQGFIEAKRIGTTIERKAIELFFSLGGKLTDDAAVQSIVREINVMKTHASMAYVSVKDQW